jgi:ubiquinone/menaquinone biosynthesis C-methylase UbiE
LEAEFIRSIIGDTTSSRVLDIGCGPGLVTLFVVSRSASLLCLTDIDAKVTSSARGEAKSLAHIERVEGIICRGERLPFEGHSFDTVLMISSLEHFGDDLATLDECRRVLRPGGHLLITTDSQPAKPGLPRIPVFLPLFRATIRKAYGETGSFLGAVLAEHASLYAVCRRYDLASLKQILSQAGFDVRVSQTLVRSRFAKALYELCVSIRILSFDARNPLFRIVSKLYPLVAHFETRSDKTDGYVVAAMAVTIENQTRCQPPTGPKD